MAAVTDLAASRVKAVGSFTEVFYGRVDATGTSSVVTIPQAKTVLVAVVTPEAETGEECGVTAYSTNTFTVTHESGIGFSWIAVATGGV